MTTSTDNSAATATMKINAIAESAGVEIAMHAGCNDAYGQHLCYALPNNLWGEFNIDSAAMSSSSLRTSSTRSPAVGKCRATSAARSSATGSSAGGKTRRAVGGGGQRVLSAMARAQRAAEEGDGGPARKRCPVW